MNQRQMRALDKTDKKLQAERERRTGEFNPRDNNGREKIVLRAPEGCHGAEIGVSTGQLSRRFLEEDHLGLLHSVDPWNSQGHMNEQYKAVCEILIGYDRPKVWRLTGQEFAEIIPDNSLGFIYIDCFAHTGQDDGGVLKALWPKLMIGGIFSGDDYDEKHWPKTYAAVNRFADEHGYRDELTIESAFIGRVGAPTMDGHPSWWFVKH